MDKEVFNYTVAELIEVLSAFPDNLPVIVSGLDKGYENFTIRLEKNMVHEPENVYKFGQFQIDNKDDDSKFDAILLSREVRYD